jgi:hypothetical protein
MTNSIALEASASNVVAPAAELGSSINMVGADITGALKSFQSIIATMLREFADEGSDLHIDGTVIAASQKNSAAVQLLVDQKLATLQNSAESIMSIFNGINQLYKAADSMLTAS